jgi:hypothetical protein
MIEHAQIICAGDSGGGREGWRNFCPMGVGGFTRIITA